MDNDNLNALLSGSQYNSFREEIGSVIKKQILSFAQPDMVNRVIGLGKGSAPKDAIILFNILALWTAFNKLVDNDKLFLFLLIAGNSGGQFALDQIVSGETFDLKQQSILKDIEKRGIKLSSLVDNTTQHWIVNTIDKGLNNNLSIIQIAKILRDEAPRQAFLRADKIAEYETALVYSQVIVETYKRNGVTTVKWVTVKDERTCPTCMGNESQGSIPLGNLFSSGVDKPPTHPFDRCFLLPDTINQVEESFTG